MRYIFCPKCGDSYAPPTSPFLKAEVICLRLYGSRGDRRRMYVKEAGFNLSPEIKEAHWIPVSGIGSHLNPHNPKNLLSITIKNYLTNLK